MTVTCFGAYDVRAAAADERRLVRCCCCDWAHLVVVFIALFLDNVFLTVVVPIIPDFLYQQEAASNTIATTSVVPSVVLTTVATGNGSSLLVGDVEFLITNNTAPSTTSIHGDDLGDLRHIQLLDQTLRLGVMLASKAIVQIITGPLVGICIKRVGYSMPLLVGLTVMFAAMLLFAFATSYPALFCARAIHGVGSACVNVAGLGMVAKGYTDNTRRGRAMGIVLLGLALGVIVGPPFGGTVYEFAGKQLPFLILAGLILINGILHVAVLSPSGHYDAPFGSSNDKTSPWSRLLRDPYILAATGALTIGNLGIAMLEASLPLHMMDTMNASQWQQGVAFVPATVAYLIGTGLVGAWAHHCGRWPSALAGIVIGGVSLSMIPLVNSMLLLMLPMGCLGFGLGMVESSLLPQLAHLVDLRHKAAYGTVYAIGDVSMNLGLALGPLLTGPIVINLGFEWMMWIVAIVTVVYAPLLVIFRSPPIPSPSHPDTSDEVIKTRQSNDDVIICTSNDNVTTCNSNSNNNNNNNNYKNNDSPSAYGCTISETRQECCATIIDDVTATGQGCHNGVLPSSNAGVTVTDSSSTHTTVRDILNDIINDVVINQAQATSDIRGLSEDHRPAPNIVDASQQHCGAGLSADVLVPDVTIDVSLQGQGGNCDPDFGVLV